MNRKQFREYFRSNDDTSGSSTNDEVRITSIISSASNNITNAEVALAEEELRRCARPRKYQCNIPENVKREVGAYALEFGTKSAIKKFTKKYPRYVFIRTSVNNWKCKCKTGQVDVNFQKKIGRPNLLEDDLLKKVNDIAIGTRLAGGVINRRQLICIANGVVKANNPNLLKEFGGPLELSEKWARGVLGKLNWSKRKATTGKLEPSPQLLLEEKFTFQKEISTHVSNHDIPPSLVLNLDQTPLPYVTPGKYTFSLKGTKHVPIKGVDDKRQITATFAVSSVGNFLPVQLIYAGKTSRCLPKFKFPEEFSVTFTENHWSNTTASIAFFNEIIFPYLNKVKMDLGLPEEQFSLVIMDTFKGQDNDTIKELCLENNCEITIVPHNLTHVFQPLDLSVNKAAKSFVQNKYNEWFADQVSQQLTRGILPADVKVSSKISLIKPLHAQWIVNLYEKLRKEPAMIINGFEASGISEAINQANAVITRVENPFRGGFVAGLLDKESDNS